MFRSKPCNRLNMLRMMSSAIRILRVFRAFRMRTIRTKHRFARFAKPRNRSCREHKPHLVVGPSGEEIFTDKYGRVKVQFYWDRQGQMDAGSSCWIRVGTFWAGKQWGVIHIPRIGQEVIVDFLEGDPDQPIIVGSVYNPETMPPYALPDNKTQSGVKSRSSKDGSPSNFNEFRFEDKKGKRGYLSARRKELDDNGRKRQESNRRTRRNSDG